MKLTDLLENYKPVYPQSQQWEDTFALFEQNPTDKEIITQLIEEHNRDGKFREPIILSTPEEDTDEDTGEYQPHIKNGTHRVYVTHLLGLENAQTHYGWPDTPNPHTDENGYPYTVTHYSYTTNQHETPDTETDIFDYLRSIKINDTLWVTSDYMTLTNDHQGSIYWSQPITTPNLIQQLHTQINHKIRNTHISSINLNTQTIHNEQEEQQLHNK